MRRWIVVFMIIIGLLAACTVSVSEAPPSTPLPSAENTAVETAITQADVNDETTASDSSLTGRIIFADDLKGIQQYDFASNELSTLFQPPARAVTRNLAVSPDGKVILFSYAPPPPEEDSLQFGFTDLYTMPVDGSSEPTALLEGDEGSELFFLPAWSPDGTYIYYSHILPNPDGEGSIRQIERMAYPDGEADVIVSDGFSSKLSDDGIKLVYVVPNLDANRDDLFVSNPDGTGAVSIIENNFFSAIDAPIFTPDGEYVIFSAVVSGNEQMRGNPTRTVAAILDYLMGVQTVKAHSVPSDLWQVPVTGGRPTQITFLAAINMWPEFSPDGQKLAVLSSTRIHIMNPDGSGREVLLNEGASGTMDWVP